jgi:hypothetical protein
VRIGEPKICDPGDVEEAKCRRLCSKQVTARLDKKVDVVVAEHGWSCAPLGARREQGVLAQAALRGAPEWTYQRGVKHARFVSRSAKLVRICVVGPGQSRICLREGSPHWLVGRQGQAAHRACTGSSERESSQRGVPRQVWDVIHPGRLGRDYVPAGVTLDVHQMGWHFDAAVMGLRAMQPMALWVASS